MFVSRLRHPGGSRDPETPTGSNSDGMIASPAAVFLGPGFRRDDG